MKVIHSLSELEKSLGSTLAISRWFEIDQQRIDAFAELTGDHQWIHCDVERAARESPFGTTVAHGYLVLSLVAAMADDCFRMDGFHSKLNYGLNRVRFIQPVLCGSRIRAHFVPQAVHSKEGGRYQLVTDIDIELEGQETPACAAQSLTLLIP
ncbi:MaoC family dehydratase [Halomonas eurihalina]|uniref:MaoC family dehydratase n=1 Tax=Halomonas eurihalina TaxID=42566 RepID=A0A5D9D4W0_HALER|nr:MaoC family dehydratase [Halomonas eurihalina]MDR5858816.1 MaoC family dehydratase [Halomonas eurihalina]TZG38954.1 MaoC family dehydratase [Halomonas eurihalina]